MNDLNMKLCVLEKKSCRVQNQDNMQKRTKKFC